MNSVDPVTRDLVINGVLSDTISAIDALEINLLIGSFHEEINKRGYGLFFGSIQSFSDHIALISIRRLFKKPSKKYPNRSIFSLFDHLKKCNFSTGSGWPNIQNLHTHTISLQSAEIINSIWSRNIASLLAQIEAAAPSLERDPPRPIDKSLRMVRELADKEVAHNENVELKQRANYSDVFLLLDFVKDVFNLVIEPVCGWPYDGGRVQKPIGSLANILSYLLSIRVNEIWQQHNLRQQSGE